jgi:predicted nucleic acid-binding protein
MTDLLRVVVDANVLLSLLIERNEVQQAKAQALLRRAENGEVVVVLAQFILFETIYAFRTSYDYSASAVTAAIRDAMALPGVIIVDDCPWQQFFEYWSDRWPDVGDAAILALSIEHRYSLATFDHKLSNRARTLGVSPYW